MRVPAKTPQINLRRFFVAAYPGTKPRWTLSSIEQAAASCGYPQFGTGIASSKSIPTHVPRASTPGIRMGYFILALCLTGRCFRSRRF
jgi:hypothetical protein